MVTLQIGLKIYALVIPHNTVIPVSYTHLYVYKRQNTTFVIQRNKITYETFLNKVSQFIPIRHKGTKTLPKTLLTLYLRYLVILIIDFYTIKFISQLESGNNVV